MKTAIVFLGLLAVFVSCSHSAPPDMPGQKPAVLTFHIVSKDKIEGWKEVDLPGARQRGYIAPDPDLILSQLKSIQLYKRSLSNPLTSAVEECSGIQITLLDEDAPAFTAMSRRAYRHQVLVMLGDKSLVAPLMTTAITDPVFDIQTNGRGEKQLHEALMKLVK